MVDGSHKSERIRSVHVKIAHVGEAWLISVHVMVAELLPSHDALNRDYYTSDNMCWVIVVDVRGVENVFRLGRTWEEKESWKVCMGCGCFHHLQQPSLDFGCNCEVCYSGWHKVLFQSMILTIERSELYDWSLRYMVYVMKAKEDSDVVWFATIHTFINISCYLTNLLVTYVICVPCDMSSSSTPNPRSISMTQVVLLHTPLLLDRCPLPFNSLLPLIGHLCERFPLLLSILASNLN